MISLNASSSLSDVRYISAMLEELLPHEMVGVSVQQPLVSIELAGAMLVDADRGVVLQGVAASIGNISLTLVVSHPPSPSSVLPGRDRVDRSASASSDLRSPSRMLAYLSQLSADLGVSRRTAWSAMQSLARLVRHEVAHASARVRTQRFASQDEPVRISVNLTTREEHRITGRVEIRGQGDL